MRVIARSIACLWMAAGCTKPPPITTSAVATDRIAIIGAEQGPHGARLVAIDEHGNREFVLVEPASSSSSSSSSSPIVRDQNPAVSPDGRWVVFASTRDRPVDETSLWIARLGPEARPHRLTNDAKAIDSQPSWTPDGTAIVFASTRARGNFDLWRLAITGGTPTGEPVQLTTAPGHEIEPSVARDGTIIYASVATDGTESHLEARAPDGTISRLSSGPGDLSPAISPDGKTIAFSRPVAHLQMPDADLWRMNRDGSNVSQVIDLRLTDEGGPVWSADGRYLFATSQLRGADRRPLFSSIIHVDLGEPTPVARMLEDRAGAIVRLTPALTTTPLDTTALHADPEYLPELARIMTRAIEEQRAKP